MLAILLVVGVTASLRAGQDRHAQPSIAGTYAADGSSPCLGRRFDLAQSGQFITLQNPEDTLGGGLRFRGGRVTGTASCVEGTSAEVDLNASGQALAGSVGGQRLDAALAGRA